MATAKSSWKAMKTRCTNKNQKNWVRYGGRGIAVCEQWNDFSIFLADMGEPPTPKHTLERIDNDGNYEPSNCTWATYKEQAANKSNTIKVVVDGVEKSLQEWCDEYGVKSITAHMRIIRGWEPARAVTTAATYKNNSQYILFEYENEVLTLAEIAAKSGINYHTLRQRVITNGESIESALSRPVKKS